MTSPGLSTVVTATLTELSYTHRFLYRIDLVVFRSFSFSFSYFFFFCYFKIGDRVLLLLFDEAIYLDNWLKGTFIGSKC